MLILTLQSDLSQALTKLSETQKICKGLSEENLKLKTQLAKSKSETNFGNFCLPDLKSTTTSNVPTAQENTPFTSFLELFL